MSLTALEYKNQGNGYYPKNEWILAIESYNEGIKLLQTTSDESVPLYLLYLNRSAAYIREKNFYNGYQDAKESLKLKKDENLKGYYRAGICAYHLGFIEKSKELIKEGTKDHQENLLDYLDLKFLIEKKVNAMKKWRKSNLSAKKSLKKLEKLIQEGNSMNELPSILYHIRYLLRSFFRNKKDQKLMNINTGDLGYKLHELAVEFNSTIDVDELIKQDPLFEDLVLNEMPDVGLLRLKAYKQRNLPRDKRNYNLVEKASDDLAAYEFSFFINNILSSLVVNSTDENLSLRALKQIHRLTVNDLYRKSLGDALSDSINNYIYRQSRNSFLLNKLILNDGIEIFFYDFIEASCQESASQMIKILTADQWKRQSLTTIQFVIKQISKKIHFEGIELVEPEEPSKFEIEIKKIFGLNPSDNDEKENFNIIINVFTKILMVFGKQPFIDRSLVDPLFVFVNQIWFQQFDFAKHRYDIPFLLNGWSSILTQWLKLDYDHCKIYIQQIPENQLDDHDDD